MTRTTSLINIHLLVVLLLLCCGVPAARAQKSAIKTNILYDALLSPNIGIELAVASRWTVDVSGQFNLWKHWMAQPEVRYWFCDRFAGHFVGAHLLGGQYNIGGLDIPMNILGTDFRKLKETRFQGWFGGAGVAYGYDWVITKSFNIEAELGIGWTYTLYDQFRCTGCGKKIQENQPHNYFGVTKAAINLVYIF